MLESVKISKRQSEIRQVLAELSRKEKPTEDEIRKIDDFDGEYRANESKYRAALIAEDEERREAGAELETKTDREWSDLVARFEIRQVASALDEGRAFEGETAEIVSEMRASGSYRGIPVPLEALVETRAGETIASGTPDPVAVRPTIDRLFADSVAARMGVQTINIGAGGVDYPVVTSAVSAGWANGELADVPGPTAFAVTDTSLRPDHTLGVQMEVSRKAMKQSGTGLESAIRRDMAEAIRTAMDQAVFRGSGATGEPTGILTSALAAAATHTDVDAPVTWAAIRAQVVAFMAANAASSPAQVRLMIRPEIWSALDGAYLNDGAAVDPLVVTGDSEWQFLTRNIPTSNIVMTSNALAAPAGGPPATSNALLTTNAGGVAPALVGVWGGVDMIRDPFSLAQSGQLKLTGLVTCDVAVLRSAQIHALAGLQ